MLDTKEKNNIKEDSETNQSSIDNVFKELENCDDVLNKLKKSLKLHLACQAKETLPEAKEKNYHATLVVRRLIKAILIEIGHIGSLLDADEIEKDMKADESKGEIDDDIISSIKRETGFSLKEKEDNYKALHKNVIIGSSFEDMYLWSACECSLAVVSDYGALIVSKRTHAWSGPRFDITSRISVGLTYKFQAQITFLDVKYQYAVVTIKVHYEDGTISYMHIARGSFPNRERETLSGTFALCASVKNYILYIETKPMNCSLSVHDFAVENISLVEESL